jgi:hypothetical protein
MKDKNIYQKLLEFQTTIETIKKDGKNSFFKKPNGKESSYATLPNILAEVKPLLNALKLVLTQPIINGEVFSIITCSETKEEVKSSMVIPSNLNAQQSGSAVTYFRRYTLSSLLSLEIDEDDDGNKASQPQAESKPETIWLKDAEFEIAMKGTKKQIIATLNAYNGKNGKSMKKEFTTKLSEQLSKAPTE